MAQDDAQQRIADLERQLAEAKGAAPPPFPSPPQASAPFGAGPPMAAGPTYLPPIGQPLSQPAFFPPGPGYKPVGLRVVRGFLHLFWWAGIGCVGFGIYLGVKVHRVSQDGQNATCGNVFDAIFKHAAYHQFGGGDTLRSVCAEQIAKALTMTYDLVGLGVLLIFASLITLVINWIMKWRLGWRPWRPYGPYGRGYARRRSAGGDVVGGIIDIFD